MKQASKITTCQGWITLINSFETLRLPHPKDIENLVKSKNQLDDFLTDHCCLKKHLLKMGVFDIDECRFFRKEDEIIVHLVTGCFGVVSQRKVVVKCNLF